MTYTRLPYKEKVHKLGSSQWIYLAHPPERLRQTQVVDALLSLRRDEAERCCRRIPRLIAGHEPEPLAIKLAAINALARANGRDFISLANAINDYSRAAATPMNELIAHGSPNDAEDLMQAVANCLERRYHSLISKYLSFHGAGRWMVYDSYVRAYLWATTDGYVRRKHKESQYRRVLIDALPQRRTDLESYAVYCSTVDNLWRLLPLKAPRSARHREAVFWVRAKQCKAYFD